ncbi:acyl-CoA N-acyltransferase [Fennellomyces sp. T-0311]|nr:acyl-CoA N-acyltransferase [Fennellomyces sp. T-0311]
MTFTAIYRDPQIKFATTEEDWKTCDAIRVKVFVDEVGVDKSYIVDSRDPIATVWLVTCERISDGLRVPVGTIRLLPIEGNDDAVEITRLAVLPEARGLKLGQKLVQALENEAKLQGKTSIMLESGNGSHPFYQSMGYVIEEKDKESFIKNGISHYRLWKRNL